MLWCSCLHICCLAQEKENCQAKQRWADLLQPCTCPKLNPRWNAISGKEEGTWSGSTEPNKSQNTHLPLRLGWVWVVCEALCSIVRLLLHHLSSLPSIYATGCCCCLCLQVLFLEHAQIEYGLDWGTSSSQHALMLRRSDKGQGPGLGGRTAGYLCMYVLIP